MRKNMAKKMCVKVEAKLLFHIKTFIKRRQLVKILHCRYKFERAKKLLMKTTKNG